MFAACQALPIFPFPCTYDVKRRPWQCAPRVSIGHYVTSCPAFSCEAYFIYRNRPERFWFVKAFFSETCLEGTGTSICKPVAGTGLSLLPQMNASWKQRNYYCYEHRASVAIDVRLLQWCIIVSVSWNFKSSTCGWNNDQSTTLRWTRDSCFFGCQLGECSTRTNKIKNNKY